MKNIIKICLLLPCLFFACKSEDVALPDISNDFPRIISTWPQKNPDTGMPGELNVQLGDTFTHRLIYTPTNVAVCKWYFEGEEVATGDTFTYDPTALGRYYIKVIVTSPVGETFREAYLVVY